MKQFDFGEYNKKLGKSARETLALAIEESRKRDHKYLSAHHLILGLLLIEAKFFEDLLAKTGHTIKDLRKLISSQLTETSEASMGRGLKITLNVRSLFRLAWISSFKHGRNKISSADFIQACMELDKSPLMECLQVFNITSSSISEQLEPRLMNPVIREMKITELSDDDKKGIKDAIQGDDYWKAYELLSSFYNRVYENIQEQREERVVRKTPVHKFHQSPLAFRIIAIIILLGILVFALLLAAEQVVGADDNRVSLSLAACNRLTDICLRECVSG